MNTIAHVWWDYLPKSFIEPHPYLLKDGRYRSVVFAPTVWDNGNPVDQYTHYRERKSLKQLDSPSLFFG